MSETVSDPLIKSTGRESSTFGIARWLALPLLAIASSAWGANTAAYPPTVPEERTCGTFWLPSGVGPYDYRHPGDTPDIPGGIAANLEGNHLRPETEALRAPNAGADLDYVLRAVPNHPRALLAMVRLSQKMKSENLKIGVFTIPCHFIRSITFAPDDPTVRFAYGLYLSNFGKKEASLAQFLKAEELGADNANNLYNIGLLYVDLRDYDKGLAYAKRAYAAGFPLPGLRDKLKRAGKWQE